MTVTRIRLTFDPGQSSLARNPSMDGLPLRSTDHDSSVEEDQLLPTSPVNAPADAESVSSTDVPRCAPLNSGDEDSLPDLPPPEKTTKQKGKATSKAPPPKQTRTRSKPKLSLGQGSAAGKAVHKEQAGPKRNLRGKPKAAATATENPPPPAKKRVSAAGKAVHKEQARPKRNVKGKQKADATATEDPPLPSSPSPTPEPPKKRARSSGKVKEIPSTPVSAEPAPPSPPPNIIAHVELQQALPSQQTTRARRNSKQPPIQNLRLPSFAFPINASYAELREHLARAAQISPLFVSQDITWKFMAPASSSVQPLNSDICMEALKRQIEKRIAKGQELVVLIVMGPTLSGPTVTAPAPPPSFVLPASTEDRDQSRVATVDQRVQDAAKMVRDHYPLANEATLDRPPIGSAYFKVTDVIKNRPPPKALPPSPPPATPTPAVPSGPSSVITSSLPAAFPSPAMNMFHPTWPTPVPPYHYMLYPPAFPYPPAFTPQTPPQFSSLSSLAWTPFSAQNPPSSPAGPSCDFAKFCDAAKLGPEDRDRLQEMDFVPGQKISKISKDMWDNAGIRPLTLQRIKEADRRRKLGEFS
ncbi:hypothetical protein M407DRAFT_231957 [Tulasnella calospora MUT 4182]|uniref:Uncharacterized protein n=1 Tax=Tulasnella calospora MUT 4182 TaxID=1051891 RepID=A0A0C3L4I9_9AGAM|nr:hypothetical protein M407DRAFT_231957 [Tulasnella calospora MUT 4182]